MPKQYTCISEVTVGAGGAASIEFTSIPSTFTDLRVCFSARTSRASDGDYVYLSLNGAQSDSGRYLKGYATVVETGTVNNNYLSINSTNNTSGSFSNYEIIIPSYTSTTAKTISSDGVAENNSAGTNALSFGTFTWTSGSASTSAITSITLTGRFASFVQHSTATLYGITKS